MHFRKLTNEHYGEALTNVHHEDVALKNSRSSSAACLFSEISTIRTFEQIDVNQNRRRPPLSKAHNDQGIMFINKTSSSKSLSRSEGAERATIYSYVQRSSKPRAKRIQAFATSESALKNATDTMQQASRFPTMPLRERINVLSVIEAPDPIGSAVSVQEFDPFQSTIDPIDNYMGSLLKFYKSSLSSSGFMSIKSLATVTEQCVFSLAVESPTVLNALLCGTAIAVYSSTGDARHDFKSMQFKGKSLQALKSSLRSRKSPTAPIASICGISHLLWMELFFGDLEGIKAHVLGLERMVTATNSLRDSPLPVLLTLLACYNLSVGMLRTRPMIQPPFFERELPSASFLSTVREAAGQYRHLSLMASRFQTRSIGSLSGLEFRNLIMRQKSFMVLTELNLLTHLDPLVDDVEIIYLSQKMVEYRLLSLPFEASDLTPLQEAIRVALFTISRPAFSNMAVSCPFDISMATQMRDALQRIDFASLPLPDYELLVWILFLGYYLTDTRSDRIWWFQHLARAIDVLKLTQSTMEHMLMGFFYLPRYFSETLVGLWFQMPQEFL